MKKKNALLLGIGAALALAGSVFMIWKKKRSVDTGEKPPKDAPQLDIENPGTQDEFPSSPTESEIG